jgi:hypothetical protein
MTNNNLNKIQINGENYIKESDVQELPNYKPSPVQILVLNRGWVVIGNVSESGSKTIVQNASVIRKWGTENGLGELAQKGKLSNTVLDSCPDITVETVNIVLTMNCNQNKWK